MVFRPNDPSQLLSKTTKIILALFLLPNLASLSAPVIHLWSIGVEEQFYLIWPWVLRYKNNIIKICVGVLFIKFMVHPFLPPFAMDLFYGLRFESMAIGAIGAYLYYESSPYLKWIYHPTTQLMILGGCLYIAGVDIILNTYTASGKSLVFILLILNVGTNPGTLLKLNHPILERLGQISYGLYLYHYPILYLILQVSRKSTVLNETPYTPTIILISTVVITLLLSEISYRWFETPFLELKKKFSV
jgi:peptidoglycan/LPS O-acetylase OafA/YrhL